MSLIKSGYSAAATWLPLPSNPMALVGIAAIAVIGWQYMMNGRLKVKLAESDTAIAQMESDIARFQSDFASMVARSELVAQQRINELLAADIEAQRIATERAEASAQAELRAKWAARKKLNELRESIENSDWLGQPIPAAVRDWLQFTTGDTTADPDRGSRGGGETDSADDPPAVFEELRGETIET